MKQVYQTESHQSFKRKMWIGIAMLVMSSVLCLVLFLQQVGPLLAFIGVLTVIVISSMSARVEWHDQGTFVYTIVRRKNYVLISGIHALFFTIGLGYIILF